MATGLATRDSGSKTARWIDAWRTKNWVKLMVGDSSMRGEVPHLIVLVPGITGSGLTNGDDVLWGYWRKLAATSF